MEREEKRFEKILTVHFCIKTCPKITHEGVYGDEKKSCADNERGKLEESRAESTGKSERRI